MGRSSLAEVARLAGVSPSTASRVLSNTHTRIAVSEETRKRILEIAARLDYSPNLLARRLWTSRSNIIGLVMPGRDETHRESMFTDRPFAETLAGIESVIESTDYRLMLIYRNEKYIAEKEYLSLLKTKVVDGLLIWGALLQDRYAEELAGLPAVFLSSRPKTDSPLNFVGYDNRAGSFALSKYFIDKGIASFAYMGNAGATNSIDAERFQGFSEAMNRFGLNFTLYRSRMDQESGYDAMSRILEEGNPKFKVICCATDAMALGVIMAAEARGIRIPDAFQISGADGIDDFLFRRYHFPTYKVPCAEVGIRGARRILELMERPDAEPVIELLPIELLTEEENLTCHLSEKSE